MGLFNEVGRFFETRLEEFLQNNPHLELQAIEEQLREQEQGATRLLQDLTRQEQQIEQEIMAIAKDIQHWHQRAQQAAQGGRTDLAQEAQMREAALLRQGNQTWGKMEGCKKRISQTQTILQQVQSKRQEVKAKIAEMKAKQTTINTDTAGWNQTASYTSSSGSVDPLEAKFQQWETDQQILEMKRNLGKK